MNMSKKSLIAGFFLIIAAVAFGGILIASFSGKTGLIANPQIEFKTTPPIENVNPNVKSLNDSFVEISKLVMPSVVFIDVTADAKKENNNENNRGFDFFFGPDFQMEQPPMHGSGSGVIISKDGYIMTNNHVVKDASEKGIKVVLNDKREYSAKIIGTDPNTDIAVIKIEAENLIPASVGNSDNVQVGQWVLAIGNPLGLNNTITAGIVSALGRNINISNNSYSINNFIQTDAVINPGNSGGALVDINGFVIGINTAIKTTTGYYQGYGFAVPMNLAKSVAEELIKSGKVERGYIGVAIKDLDNKEAKGFGLDKPRGVLVQNVIKDGAGDEAGLKPGDIIFSVDGKEVNAANELQTIIGSHRPGDEVKLVVYRDGSTMDKTVKLKPRSEDNISMNDFGNKSEKTEDFKSKSFENIGITVIELDSKSKSDYGVSEGIMINNVKNFSEAFNRGLRAGMVIIEVNKEKIDSVEKLSSVLSGKSKGDVVVFKIVLQNKEIRLVAVEL